MELYLLKVGNIMAKFRSRQELLIEIDAINLEAAKNKINKLIESIAYDNNVKLLYTEGKIFKVFE